MYRPAIHYVYLFDKLHIIILYIELNRCMSNYLTLN